ncbi:MAG: polysaccharide deacetylase family protein, partial [Actinobacteria bacterium]|nr:polysaccharide deacetylase family protein [Actinomycetota bacterium]
MASAVVGFAVLAVALRSGGQSPRGSAPRPAAPAVAAVSGSGRTQVSSVGGAVDRLLAYTPYVARGGSQRRDVALTFDDGPGPFTPRILRVLERTRTPATFFVVGRDVRAYRRVVAAEARAGFTIGDHTETHAPLGLLGSSAQASEITGAAI